MLRGNTDAAHSIRFMAPMRVHSWRSKLPMNLKFASLIVNDLRILRFRGPMRGIFQGNSNPAEPPQSLARLSQLEGTRCEKA